MGKRFQVISYRSIYLVSFLLLLTITGIRAGQSPDYAIQANIIYHFTKYIDWPESKKSGDFIIGIVGDTPVYDKLRSLLTNKTVGTQKIVIKKISAGSASLDCHILYIGEDESQSMKKIAERTAGAPTLLVSKERGLAEKGSCINFIVVSDHLKLEINKNNIEQRNLSIASELLKLGKVVK